METEILMEIAELDLDKDMSELREVDVARWVENRITHFSKKSIDQLHEIMREWKMDLNVDWHDRVSRYYKTYLDSMLKHDLLMSFESEDLRKKKIQGLLRGVRPPKLREVVRTKHALLQENREQTSVSVFFNLLKKQNQRASEFLSATGEDDSNKKRKREGSNRERPRHRSRPTRLETRNGRPQFREYKCYVEGCTGSHKIQDHPNITREQRIAAFEKLKIAKLNKNNSHYPTSQIAPLRQIQLLEKLSGNEVLIEHVKKATYCLDSGAERSCIGEHLLDGLGVTRYSIVPVQLDLAVKTELQPISTEQVYLDLLLNTTAGNVQLRGVETLVIPGMAEFILGDVHLRRLGIDVSSLFASKAGQIIDMSEEKDTLDKAWPDEIAFGRRTEEEITGQLEDMLIRAQKNGANVEQLSRLRTVIFKWSHVWRTKLGPDPAANVPPLKVRMKPGTKPIKGRARRTGPMQSEFLSRRLKSLEDYGYLYKNENSRCAHPVHVVKKIDIPTWDNLEDAFRWTGDFRQQNAETEPLVWPMPNLQVICNKTSGSKYFQTYDAFKGFWQLPLDPESQEYFSFITDTAVYTPTRVPQGCCDAVMYFQRTMQLIFEEYFNKKILIWLDDILGFNITFEDLLTSTEYILSQCSHYGLFLNPKKTTIFTHEVTFCGKILTSEGVQHDPARTTALANMPLPKTAGELQQFLCAMNWIRDSLPDFARNSLPLRNKLEEICQSVGKRTKVSLKRQTIVFSSDETDAFNLLREKVQQALLLTHPDPEAEFGLFCDASDEGWGSILLQIRNYDPAKPWSEQNCEPLYCLGGNFRGAASRWKIIEKEAFAIRESVERLDYLLQRPQGFRIYTDHRNLQYIFSNDPTLKRTTKQKLERWAMFLVGFRYTIEHVAGTDNCWADLLSRWATPLAAPLRTLSLHPFNSPMPFDWPSLTCISASQQLHHPDEDRKDLKLMDGYFYRNSDEHRAVWIPEADTALQTRLLIVGHFGLSGHRGISATLRLLQRYCYWRTMTSAVKTFCLRCLHCLQSRGSRVQPRPLGIQLHADEPNKILHFDFLQLTKANDGSKYVLVIKDDYSHLVHLEVTASPDAATTARALTKWFSEYRVAEIWISDQGTHFKNETMKQLQTLLRTNHHFVTAYCPWANGTVERVNRDLLAVLRALLHETKKKLEEWPDLIPVVQFVLNHTEVKSLGNHAPVEVHNGTKPSSALDAVFASSKNEVMAIPPETDTIKQHYSRLMESLTKIHKEVDEAKKKDSGKNRRQKKGTSNKALPNFEIGDYVLWSQVRDINTMGKLAVIWRGPYRIVGTVSEYVYETEHLITEQRRQVHITRLKYYHDPSLEITEELQQHIERQGVLYPMDEIRELRQNEISKKWELLISWKGFERIEDSWEPLEIMMEDIPIKVLEFLRVRAQIEAKNVRAIFRQHQPLIVRLAKKHGMDITDLLEL
jgi:transposase InsO family protein